MIVLEKIVIVWLGRAFRADVDERPAGISKMNRAGRKLGNRVGDPHFLVKIFRVFHPDDMRNVKQEVATDGNRLVFSVVGIQIPDRVQEINRQ